MALSIFGHIFHFWRETCAHCQVKAAWRSTELPSFGLFERTKRSSAFNDFPQFSWSHLTGKEEIGRGSLGCVFTAKRSDGESSAKHVYS